MTKQEKRAIKNEFKMLLNAIIEKQQKIDLGTNEGRKAFHNLTNEYLLLVEKKRLIFA